MFAASAAAKPAPAPSPAPAPATKAQPTPQLQTTPRDKVSSCFQFPDEFHASLYIL